MDEYPTIDEAERFIMPWGKYEGLLLSEVPGSYLSWLVENCDDTRVLPHVQIYLDYNNPNK